MTKYKKRTDYYIEYEVNSDGKEVYNFLEDADYITEPGHEIILTGTVGELWVTSKTTFRKKYVLPTGADLEEGEIGRARPKPDGNVIFAEVATKSVKIKTHWGTTLTAHLGDIIAYSDNSGEPDLNNRWVINQDVFRTTYKKVDDSLAEKLYRLRRRFY